MKIPCTSSATSNCWAVFLVKLSLKCHAMISHLYCMVCLWFYSSPIWLSIFPFLPPFLSLQYFPNHGRGLGHGSFVLNFSCCVLVNGAGVPPLPEDVGYNLLVSLKMLWERLCIFVHVYQAWAPLVLKIWMWPKEWVQHIEKKLKWYFFFFFFSVKWCQPHVHLNQVHFADVCIHPISQHSATWQLTIQNLLMQRLLMGTDI